MHSTRAVIQQTTRFITKSKTKKRIKELARVTGVGCEAGQAINWNNERLQVSELDLNFRIFVDGYAIFLGRI